MGRRPVPLSEAGRAQSHALVPLLRTLAPERVLTSPLARTRETADILASGLGIESTLEPDLVELDFGVWEGHLYDELVDDPAFLAFSRDPVHAAPPGGESAVAAQTRALAALGRAFARAPGGRLCVVTHGDLVRLILAAALALELREFRRIRVDTCGVSVVDLMGDRAEVKAINLLADPARIFTPVHWGVVGDEVGN